MNLSIVKVKGSCKWAQKAIIGNEVRYRGFRYKKEAISNLSEWEYIWQSDGEFARDFYHNFNTAEELGIEEIQG